MAMNLADYYSGNMSPPLRLPNGTYIPAPLTSPPMSAQEMYQGIYGSGPTTRTVKTIPISPSVPSGMDPIQQYAQSGYVAKPRFVGAMGQQQTNPIPSLPNQPAGSIRTAKDQSRLSSGPAGWDPTYGYSPIPQTPQALAAIDGATAKTGLQQVPYGVYMNNRSRDSVEYARQGRSDLMKMLERQKGDGIIDLTASNPSDRGAQGIADSQGAPVRVGSKVYYPGGKAPQGAPRATTQTQQKPTGLFGGLFGGGDGQGILSGLFGGAPASTGITAPGGGGAFVSSASSQPASSPLSGVGGENSLLPAALNNDRWRTGY